MREVQFIRKAWWAVLLFPAVPVVAAESPLPDGPNRDLVELVCSKCHTTERIAAKRMTKAEWKEEVTEMLQEEDDVSEEEKDQIIEYLAKTFPSKPEEKKNNNAALQEGVVQRRAPDLKIDNPVPRPRAIGWAMPFAVKGTHAPREQVSYAGCSRPFAGLHCLCRGARERGDPSLRSG